MGAEENSVAGRDYPATWPAFPQWFPDEDPCAAYLAKLRLPDGFVYRGAIAAMPG